MCTIEYFIGRGKPASGPEATTSEKHEDTKCKLGLLGKLLHSRDYSQHKKTLLLVIFCLWLVLTRKLNKGAKRVYS